MSYTYANTQKIINNDQYLNQLNCLHSTHMFIIYILLYYIYNFYLSIIPKNLWEGEIKSEKAKPQL